MTSDETTDRPADHVPADLPDPVVDTQPQAPPALDDDDELPGGENAAGVPPAQGIGSGTVPPLLPPR